MSRPYKKYDVVVNTWKPDVPGVIIKLGTYFGRPSYTVIFSDGTIYDAMARNHFKRAGRKYNTFKVLELITSNLRKSEYEIARLHQRIHSVKTLLNEIVFKP